MNISIKSLTHTFHNGKPHRTALLDIDLEFITGEFTAIIGPSGCGKSTLLRLIADLLQPTQGSIFIDGKSPRELRQAGEIAWMAQSPALLPWLTGIENVNLAQKLHKAQRKTRISADNALQKVGLSDVASGYPFTFSGGMQQRLALARLLALDASLWLMDEPFAAVDEITRERLAVELLDLWQPIKPTVLWVTHNIYEALRLADRILLFTASPGKVAADLVINLPRPRREDEAGFQQNATLLRSLMASHTSIQVAP